MHKESELDQYCLLLYCSNNVNLYSHCTTLHLVIQVQLRKHLKTVTLAGFEIGNKFGLPLPDKEQWNTISIHLLLSIWLFIMIVFAFQTLYWAIGMQAATMFVFSTIIPTSLPWNVLTCTADMIICCCNMQRCLPILVSCINISLMFY